MKNWRRILLIIIYFLNAKYFVIPISFQNVSNVFFDMPTPFLHFDPHKKSIQIFNWNIKNAWAVYNFKIVFNIRLMNLILIRFKAETRFIRNSNHPSRSWARLPFHNLILVFAHVLTHSFVLQILRFSNMALFWTFRLVNYHKYHFLWLFWYVQTYSTSIFIYSLYYFLFLSFWYFSVKLALQESKIIFWKCLFFW